MKMKHISSFLLTAMTILFGFIAVCTNASVKVTWCDSLAYDGGGYWTVRVPVTVENKSGVSLESAHIRVIVSQTDGTLALIGEYVAGLRVADVNGLEFLFELENEDEQRKREGVLAVGDLITLPAEADVDSTITVFLYAGITEALHIVRMAHIKGKLCCPENWNGELGTMACAHFVAGIPNKIMMEINQTYNPLRTDI